MIKVAAGIHVKRASKLNWGLAGAAAGALPGATAGYLAGDSENKWRNAAIGAGVGAVPGAVGGLHVGKNINKWLVRNYAAKHLRADRAMLRNVGNGLESQVASDLKGQFGTMIKDPTAGKLMGSDVPPDMLRQLHADTGPAAVRSSLKVPRIMLKGERQSASLHGRGFGSYPSLDKLLEIPTVRKQIRDRFSYARMAKSDLASLRQSLGWDHANELSGRLRSKMLGMPSSAQNKLYESAIDPMREHEPWRIK